MMKTIISILLLCSFSFAAENNEVKTEELFKAALKEDGETKISLLIEVLKYGQLDISSEQSRDYTRQAFTILLNNAQAKEYKYILELQCFEFYRKSYNLTKNLDEKKLIANYLLDILDIFIEKHEEENNWEEIQKLCQEQIKLSYFLKKDQKNIIEQKHKANHYFNAQKNIERYKSLIDKDPNNTADRISLIKILIIDFNDISEAKKYLTDKVSNKVFVIWRNNLNLIDKTDKSSLLKLGKWYEILSKQTVFSKEKNLNKALFYYGQINDKAGIKRIKDVLWSLYNEGPSPSQVFEFQGKTSSGLIIREYVRTREQQDKNIIVDIATFDHPVKSKHFKTSTLYQWKHSSHPISRNAIAYGYLETPVSGEYTFKHSCFYNLCAFYIDGIKVIPGKITRFTLQKGYVRIASVGYVENRGSVSVLWIPPGQKEASPIPSKYLCHSENDRKVNLPLIERKEN